MTHSAHKLLLWPSRPSWVMPSRSWTTPCSEACPGWLGDHFLAGLVSGFTSDWTSLDNFVLMSAFTNKASWGPLNWFGHFWQGSCFGPPPDTHSKALALSSSSPCWSWAGCYSIKPLVFICMIESSGLVTGPTQAISLTSSRDYPLEREHIATCGPVTPSS